MDNEKIIQRELTLDDMEAYRLARGISVAAIAREIGVSVDVYRVNIQGRLMNGEFVKTEPYDYNAAKFARFIAANEADIRAAITSEKPPVIENGVVMIHGDVNFTINPHQ